MKSSLEIALARAKNLHTPTTNHNDLIKKGQLLAGKLFQHDLDTFTSEWNKIPSQEQPFYLQGFVKSALHNIVLTTQVDQQKRSEIILEALVHINPAIETLSPAITQLLQSYASQYTSFIQELTEQLTTHLAQKNQRYFAQTGQHRSSNIQSDPEIATIYADEVKKFQLHFEEHLKQHKWRIIQTLSLDPQDFDL